MERTIKTIGIIATMGIMMILSYLLGTMKAETITEMQTVTEIREVIPDGYIPLEDIACYFIGGYDYPCFELKDVATQYNADDTRPYSDIIVSLPDETEVFREHFIDMRTVVDYCATEYGLQLYCEDGSGYYIER